LVMWCSGLQQPDFLDKFNWSIQVRRNLPTN
jgi:hypothetical protein